MNIKNLVLITIPLAFFLLLGQSCESEPSDNISVYPRDVTIKEASRVLKVDIPIPSYLPEGCEITTYELMDSTRLRETISNQDELYIYVHILWKSDGILPPVRLQERHIDINGNKGYLVEQDTANSVIWNLQPDPEKPGIFEIEVEANKQLPIDRLILIARSIE